MIVYDPDWRRAKKAGILMHRVHRDAPYVPLPGWRKVTTEETFTMNLDSYVHGLAPWLWVRLVLFLDRHNGRVKGWCRRHTSLFHRVPAGVRLSWRDVRLW